MKCVLLYSTCVAVCLLPLFSIPVTVTAAKGSASGSIGSKNAIAKVTKVTPKIDNEWIVAVADPKSPSGYSVKIKDTLYKHFVNTYFAIFMYSRTSPKDEPKLFFPGYICQLLDPNNKDFPKDNFLPRQIIDIILPGRYGSCDLKNSTEPIKASGMVNTDPKANPGVTFPDSSPFELLVNILSVKYIDTPDKDYFFQVQFVVGGNGQISGSVGGSTGGKKGGKGGAGVKAGK